MLSIISEKQSTLTGAKAYKVFIRRKKKGPRVWRFSSGESLTLCPLKKYVRDSQKNQDHGIRQKAFKKQICFLLLTQI